MTEKASREKNNYLKALGAEVVIQPIAAKYGEPDHYVYVAERLSKKFRIFSLSVFQSCQS